MHERQNEPQDETEMGEVKKLEPPRPADEFQRADPHDEKHHEKQDPCQPGMGLEQIERHGLGQGGVIQKMSNGVHGCKAHQRMPNQFVECDGLINRHQAADGGLANDAQQMAQHGHEDQRTVEIQRSPAQFARNRWRLGRRRFPPHSQTAPH